VATTIRVKKALRGLVKFTRLSKGAYYLTSAKRAIPTTEKIYMQRNMSAPTFTSEERVFIMV
jgi:hypothetical protein